MAQFIIDFFRTHFNLPNEVGQLIVDFIPRKLKISTHHRVVIHRALQTKRWIMEINQERLTEYNSAVYLADNYTREYTSGGKTYTYAEDAQPINDYIHEWIDYCYITIMLEDIENRRRIEYDDYDYDYDSNEQFNLLERYVDEQSTDESYDISDMSYE